MLDEDLAEQAEQTEAVEQIEQAEQAEAEELADEIDQAEPLEQAEREQQAGQVQETEPTAESEQVQQAELAQEDQDVELTVESVVEAVLFASDESLSAARLANIVETDTKQVRQHIKNLNEKYRANNNAFRIEQIAGGCQMLTLSPYNLSLIHI